MEEDNQEIQRDNVGSSSFFKTCFNALNALSGSYFLFGSIDLFINEYH